MGAWLWWFAGDTARWTAMRFLERLVRGGGGILLGAALYFAVLYVTGMRYRHLRGTVSLMRLLRGLGSGGAGAAGYVAAIGGFDGIHLGHRALIGRARELARAQDLAQHGAQFRTAAQGNSSRPTIRRRG